MSTETYTFNKHNFNCEKCLFTCKKKSEWNRHIDTKKHLTIKNEALINKINIKNAEVDYYVCETCNKIYKCRNNTNLISMKKMLDEYKENMLDEYYRLLYVALTRSEDYIYVMGASAKSQISEKSWYSLMSNHTILSL